MSRGWGKVMAAVLDAVHDMPDKDRAYRSKSCYVPQIAAYVYGVEKAAPSQLYAVRRAIYRLQDEGEVKVRQYSYGGPLLIDLVE